ncbi:MAG: 1-(5-phosphoribosyl)-5-[(5-phosphoribosylamino)methylideneamino]imidazole-4-carboxamide isomerase [Thermomonas sp.]|uniref:1-(5-phosphoribosyl)-5-[(5- phosphoribosylamino)methylideneamino]imidazole-4- carboxamide isomerase n=1 Tax=Thermomonas sp. TaxID=1971895 RepID=UPI001DCBED5D|nr:1-(5-phosphoribosyl)-5-[(5-phosphoribosylamino)methylideneamino]imidazole-4-carboxamide isomerase [Thermomonas sp.]MBZ0087724.1 1-(5-phosphoribosyl)-5-[(5-phosphoribosylamino)methylideneamino]imidazole-4-carboxamide isomerase [Thermomonas sp.]
MSFTVYPAIDVRDGRVVRLRQGDYAAETRYPDTPLALARRYAEAGARWLHLVDLDAAKAGGYTLAPLLAEIVRETGLQVQTGGGVRSRADVEALLAAGATRVVVGSLAVREPSRVMDWLEAFGGEALTVALDTRQAADGQWRLPVHGWTETSTHTLDVLLPRYAQAGLRHLLCTDIARDGMLAGVNLGLYRHLCAEYPCLQVQASGGVRGIADVIGARAAGCASVVLGKALLDGHLSLKDVLAC